MTELKVGEGSGDSSSRRGSTFFTGPNTGSGLADHGGHEDEDLDYKEQFRSTILRMYAENERIRKQHQAFQENQYRRRRLKDTAEQKEQSKVYLFIRYMATEHETLLQFLIFLPVILTALYIALIEKQPLIKYH